MDSIPPYHTRRGIHGNITVTQVHRTEKQKPTQMHLCVARLIYDFHFGIRNGNCLKAIIRALNISPHKFSILY